MVDNMTNTKSKKQLQLIIKRTFDYLFCIILAICSSPFFLIAVLIVKIASPESPVMFKQKRVGYKQKEMVIYKLRSMTNECDENGNLLPDEVRLKTWGKIIRKTNLDEIPQILNIFKNEMSLIGPRPILPKEMLIMSEDEQKERQSVYPGITGWEAVHERDSSTRREMAEFDLYYVRNWSLWLDIKVVFMTAFEIFGFRRPEDSVRAPDINKELETMQNKAEKESAKYE